MRHDDCTYRAHEGHHPPALRRGDEPAEEERHVVARRRRGAPVDKKAHRHGADEQTDECLEVPEDAEKKQEKKKKKRKRHGEIYEKSTKSLRKV